MLGFTEEPVYILSKKKNFEVKEDFQKAFPESVYLEQGVYQYKDIFWRIESEVILISKAKSAIRKCTNTAISFEDKCILDSKMYQDVRKNLPEQVLILQFSTLRHFYNISNSVLLYVTYKPDFLIGTAFVERDDSEFAYYISLSPAELIALGLFKQMGQNFKTNPQSKSTIK